MMYRKISQMARNQKFSWLFLLLALVVAGCIGQSNPPPDTTNAHLVVAIKNPEQLASNDTAQRAIAGSPPAAITSILITVSQQDGSAVSSGDILASSGQLTLTVPPGVALSVAGAAYAGEEIRFRGQSSVDPLIPGDSTTISLTLVPYDPSAPGFPEAIQIDINAQGTVANGASDLPFFTSNSRAVLFRSTATNLVDNDTNNQPDLFLKDLATKEITLVHTDASGAPANGGAESGVMSADGQLLAFASDASNLVQSPPDSNGVTDVFYKNLADQTVQRLSLTSDGQESTEASALPRISDDGKTVVFYSDGALAGNDAIGIFVKHMDTGELANLGPGQNPIISGDGSILVYWDSTTQTLVRRPVDGGAITAIYGPADIDLTSDPYPYAVDSSGRYVAFLLETQAQSQASLVSQNNLAASGVYVYDHTTGTRHLMSTDTSGAPLDINGALRSLTMSSDGQFLAFAVGSGIFVKHTISGALQQLGAVGSNPVLSPNGAYVAFRAQGTNNLFVIDNPLYAGRGGQPKPPAMTTVAIDISGSGSGAVVSSDGHLDCSANCEVQVPVGTLLSLQAKPGDNSSFSGWSADCIGSNNSNPGRELTVGTKSLRCGAFFTADSSTLTLSVKGGPNAGRVDTAPGVSPALNCVNQAETQTICNANYAVGTSVTLIPTPGGANNTVSWIGCDVDNGLKGCQVNLTTSRAVSATFGTQSFALTVRKAGDGKGTVVSTDQGINCGTVCSQNYISGTTVTLTATPEPGSRFAGWSQDCAAPGTSATITMAANRNCTATFTADKFTLTVNKVGGGGTIISGDNQINCGNTCSAPYSATSQVVLVATSDANSHFVGWGGDCSGTNASVTVTMDNNKLCTANFELANFSLTINKTGSGTGTVTSSDGSISCGSTCGVSFASGTPITLTAAPANGNVFRGWGGACAGTGTQTSVTVNSNLICTAEFVQTFPLQVTLVGKGSVASNPTGISCGSSCNAVFDFGTSVTLTATPASGATFGGWSGDCTGASPSITIDMTAAKTCTANFVSRFQLTVTKAGTGTVTSNPAGINCGTGAACRSLFNEGSEVTLTAAAGTGSVFAGWSGDCSGAALSTAVTMTSAKTCTATFNRAGSLTVLVDGSGAAGGQVTSQPAGIDCPAGACSASFVDGTLVTLTAATSNNNVQFSQWSGACTRSPTNPQVATVTIQGSQNCTATFTAIRTLTININGGGSVQEAASGASCDSTQAPCSIQILDGTQDQLQALPDPGSTFAGWTGDCGTSSNPLTSFVVNADMTCTATFAATQTGNLVVTVTGDGSGVVTSLPDGINCTSGTCAADFPLGGTVLLVADPLGGTDFAGWTGGCVGSAGPDLNPTISVPINGPTDCTATFTIPLL